VVSRNAGKYGGDRPNALCQFCDNDRNAGAKQTHPSTMKHDRFGPIADEYVGLKAP